MSRIVMFLDVDPPKTTFQQRSNNYIPKPQLRLAKAKWKAVLEPHVPLKPLEGALELKLVLTFKKKTQDTTFRTTRPDGVNILKMVEDIMTELNFWHDDNQLSIETVERYNAPYGSVCIELKTLGKVGEL